MRLIVATIAAVSLSIGGCSAAQDALFSSTISNSFRGEVDKEQDITIMMTPRELADNNNNNNNNNANNANNNDDQSNSNSYYHYYTWLKSYSLRFESCHNLVQYDSQGIGFGHQTLVKYRVCPKDTCGFRCRGGAQYVADAADFVPAYLETKMSSQQRVCNTQQKTCSYYCQNVNQYNNNGNNNNNNGNSCLTQCLTDAGYDYCANSSGNGSGINVENYLDCSQMTVKNYNTGNYYYGKAYCSTSGKALYLGLYSDNKCTERVTNGAYDTLSNYGITIPYTHDSIVSPKECISCVETKKSSSSSSNNNNNNNNDQYNYYQQQTEQVSHYCEKLYSKSLKCESRSFSDAVSPNSDGCRFIKRTLPALDDANRGSRGRIFGKILTWFFAIASFYLLIIACLMGKKKKNRKDRLLEQDVNSASPFRSNNNGNQSHNASNSSHNAERASERHQKLFDLDDESHNGTVNTANTSDTKKSSRSKSPFKIFKKNKNGSMA